MSRPQDLAEVARRAREDEAAFADAQDEFLDEFYLDHPIKERQQARIDAAPELTGDPFLDAWIGAMGEHLAQRWGLKVPAWTRRPGHFGLSLPRFVPETPSLRGVLLVLSPPAFRSRMLFTTHEPLQRARFPQDERRDGYPLAWPPRDADAR